VTPLDAIKARAAADDSIVQFILNNNYLASDPNLAFSTFAPSPPDVCLVFLKTWATEGSDRTTLEADWNSAAVVNNVADRCPNTVVITHSGGPNTMPWASHPNVKAIVAAHFPGQESGNSIVDILYGVVNPSGKLPYTIANSEAEDKFAPITDSPELRATTDPNAWQSDFEEGPLIDYRHFDYYNSSVLYEFGFGLSYTTFGMANLVIAKIDEKVTARAPAAKTAPGGNPNLFKTIFRVTVAVSNTGAVAGAAVPQLYLSLPPVYGITASPLRVLRGFEKVLLQPGQSQTVTFNLMRRDVSFWDTVSQEWVIAPGKIGVHAGFSSRDFKVESSFTPL
jgi:beta-glucosidase